MKNNPHMDNPDVQVGNIFIFCYVMWNVTIISPQHKDYPDILYNILQIYTVKTVFWELRQTVQNFKINTLSLQSQWSTL